MKKIFLLGLGFLMLFACKDNVPSKVKNIYENRIDILQTFENISIDKRNDFRSLTFYCEGLSNAYYYIMPEGKLEFIRDSIQFNPAKLHKSYLEQEHGVEDYLFFYLEKMEEYNLLYVNSDSAPFGIKLQLRLRGIEVFYVPDTNTVVIPNWIKYVKTAHKLDDYWYWKSL